MEKTPRWQATALAVAAAVALGAWGSDAHALALGRITVQSALGEPLRADIDIPDINAEEAASLRASVASADAFKAAGLEYNPAMGNLQITLQRRPDGRMFLRLAGDRTVNDPFIDLILEANWSSGRIVRDYTMLFDPPNLRQGTAPVPTAPQTSAAPSAALPPAPMPSRPMQVSPPSAVSVSPPVTRSPAARPAPAPAAVRPAPAPVAKAPAPAGAKKVTVQAGDTAGRIAAANKPASVSLDQMLVALLRANPDAFIGSNINRIRAGAVLDMPSAEQAASISTGEAGQTIVAQSKDFNDFRQRLAQGVATTQAPGANRQASGKLQAKVEDKKPAAATPDKLTLSKGATAAAKANEDKIARERQSKDAATRVAELSKNISDLSRLTAMPGAPGTTPAGAASAARPGVALPTGAPAAPATTAASAARAAASTVAPAMAAAAAASTAASAAKATAVTVAAAPAPAATPAPAPAAPVAAPAMPAILSASASAAAASAASPTPAPAAMAASVPVTAPPAAPAASAPKPVVKAPATPPPPPETSLLDDLLENPIVPAAGVGLLALLLGFGFYRARQRKKSAQVDSSFLESRLQPDSFFGASGGQRIDTNEGGPTGSSMVYSPSQLDAAGDVDPVAEADVYLAYGRDLQAEEILKEAMRTSPTRVAIHSKLLEIYAKRRDAKAFEFVATEAHSLTHGEGPDWEHISELGQELDPSNPLYRGGQPAPVASLSDGILSDDEPRGFAAATQPQMLAPEFAQSQPVDLDLDLDFSIDGPGSEATQTLSAYAVPPEQSTVAIPAMPEPPSLDMDFGSGTIALPPSPPPPAHAPPAPDDLSFDIEPVMLDAPDLTLSENDLAFTPEPPRAPPPPAPPAPHVAAPEPALDSGMIEFDMGSFSLELPPAPAPSPAAAATLAMPELDQHDIDTAGAPLSTSGAPLSTQGFDDTGDDPLGTKLALAEEFNAIGDPDGARSLAEEVVAEASGALKARAQRFLAELG